LGFVEKDITIYSILAEATTIRRKEEHLISVVELSDADESDTENRLPQRNVWGILVWLQQPVGNSAPPLALLLRKDGSRWVIERNPIWK